MQWGFNVCAVDSKKDNRLASPVQVAISVLVCGWVDVSAGTIMGVGMGTGRRLADKAVRTPALPCTKKRPHTPSSIMHHAKAAHTFLYHAPSKAAYLLPVSLLRLKHKRVGWPVG